MSEFLSHEQIKETADKLEKELGVKIYPLEYIIPAVYEDNDIPQDQKEPIKPAQQIVGYLREADLQAKLRITDVAMSSPLQAGQTALMSMLIKEHSDPLILNDSKIQGYDSIYIGACQDALSTIKSARNQYKKK